VAEGGRVQFALLITALLCDRRLLLGSRYELPHLEKKEEKKEIERDTHRRERVGQPQLEQELQTLKQIKTGV
jgi:hypothetical protein